MCYEESFFTRWTRKRAQQREKTEAVVERIAPKQPSQPTPAPTRPATKTEPKKTERELEVV